MHDKNLGFGITVEPRSGNAPQASKGGSGSVNLLALINPLMAIQKLGESILNALANRIKIVFPENYYPPVGSETVDFRALESVAAGIEFELFKFTCPEGMTFRFSKYALFTDILLAVDVDFIPLIDGNRILRYHGDPNFNFKMNLAIGPDLSDNCCIPCDFELRSGQTLSMVVKNNSATPSPVGARFFGYKVNQNSVTRPFGG